MHIKALLSYAPLYFIAITMMNVIPAINLKNYEGIRFVGLKSNQSYIVNTESEHSGIKKR